MIECRIGVTAVIDQGEMTNMIFLFVSRGSGITHLGALAGTEGQVSH